MMLHSPLTLEAVWELARILHDEMEYLAPGSPDVRAEWDKIGDRDRRVYFNSVKRLLEETGLLKIGIKFTAAKTLLSAFFVCRLSQ